MASGADVSDKEKRETGDVSLLVKNPTDRPGTAPFSISVPMSQSIAELKTVIASQYPGRPPVDRQRLIFSGKLLNDTSTLEAVLAGFDVSEPQTFHIVVSGLSASSTGTPLAGAGSPNVAPLATPYSNGPAPEVAMGSGIPGTHHSPRPASPPHPQGPYYRYGVPGVAPGMPAMPGVHGVPGVDGIHGMPSQGMVPPGMPPMYPPPSGFPPNPYMPPNPYYFPSAPGFPMPPPPDDAHGNQTGYEAGRVPGAPGGFGNMQHPNSPYGGYGQFGIDPNYVAHLEAMQERFAQDLAAQEQLRQQNQLHDPNAGADERRGGIGIAFQFDRVDNRAGAHGHGDDPNRGAGAVPNNANDGRPRVRHYAFQFELNWSLISKLIFLVVLLGQEGSSHRVYALVGAAVIIYLWQTGRLGLVRRGLNALVPTPTELFDMVAPVERDGDERRPVSRSAIALSYTYTFVYGLVCSLLPSWEPAPVPHLQWQRELDRNQAQANDQGGGGLVQDPGQGQVPEAAHEPNAEVNNPRVGVQDGAGAAEGD